MDANVIALRGTKKHLLPNPGSRESLEGQFLAQLGELFTALGRDEFYPTLKRMLCQVAEFSDIVVAEFCPDEVPTAPFVDSEGFSIDACSAFIQGAYQSSPFYLAGLRGRGGFATLSELEGDGFRESVYFREFLATAGIEDEAAYVVTLPAGVFYVISLGRREGEAGLEQRQREALVALAPVVQEAVARHHELRANAVPADSDNGREARLERIAVETLTGREREIVSYLVRGYSSKACARELNISPATERVHRKNIYQKLGVNSQSALLAHVFDRLFVPE